jgi:hypothetical protein
MSSVCICVVQQIALIKRWQTLLNLNTHFFSQVTVAMRLFSHGSEEKLRCPYKGCEKNFEKPTVVTDTETIPRQTHYACPFCMSKLDIITEKERIVGVKATEYPKVFDSPAKCAHFSGLLNAPPGSLLTQDECLICPKVLQCEIRKK